MNLHVIKGNSRELQTAVKNDGPKEMLKNHLSFFVSTVGNLLYFGF